MELQQITGEWHIFATNFPMWLKGNRTNPTFNYSIDKYRNGIRLLDVVSYIQNGSTKTIKGYDFPLNEENSAFEWRGKGLLYFIRSKWRIIYANTKYEWMIIYFEKTLFTPRGYDIITRRKNPSEIIRNEIMTYLIENSHLPELKTLTSLG